MSQSAAASAPPSAAPSAAPPPLSYPRSPLLALGALEQARRIREGLLSSQELVGLYLGRIGRLDGRYSAFVQVSPERARQEARRKDHERGKDKLPPFHGVPVGIKDLHAVRGFVTRMGTRGLPGIWSPFDDGLARTIRRAGFVIVGKTSTSEVGLMPYVEPDIHPPTRR